MIIDCHTHLFPESICSGRECYCEAEPAFELLYRSPKSRLVSTSELLTAMDQNGVDKSVVFGFPWQNPELFKMHNDCILEAMQQYPQRLIGFGCFDPASNQAAKEAERCLDAGLAGIGELAFYRSGLDDEALGRLAPVMDICRERDRSVPRSGSGRTTRISSRRSLSSGTRTAKRWCWPRCQPSPARCSAPPRSSAGPRAGS